MAPTSPYLGSPELLVIKEMHDRANILFYLANIFLDNAHCGQAYNKMNTTIYCYYDFKLVQTSHTVI